MNLLMNFYRLASIALVLSLTACLGDSGGGGGSSGGGGGTPSSYTIGGTVTGLSTGESVTLLDHGTNSLTVYANGPFILDYQVAGNYYNVTVGTQPNGESCDVSNGSGTVGTANVSNVSVVCTMLATAAPSGAVPSGNYAYTANFDSTISQYSIGTDGTLTSMATPVVADTGTYPYSVAVDPTNHYVYVANSNFGGVGSGSVSQYIIFTGGALIPMSTPSVAAGGGADSVVVDSSGHYVYVANSSDNTISQYTIGTYGMLTPMTTPSVAAGGSPDSVAVDPSGQYVYVANFTPNSNFGTISQYTIGTGGALTPMATPNVTTESNPTSVVVDPSGRYVYVANMANGNGVASSGISQYTIGVGGALTPMTPSSVAAANPTSVTVDPTGHYAYVASNFGQDQGAAVSQYIIGTSGALTPMSPAYVASGNMTDPNSVIVDPTGHYVYVASYNNGNGGNSSGVSQYPIGFGGVLTPVATPNVAYGHSPVSIATTH